MSQPNIDLRSDTVTKPTAGMRRAMAEAEVGDDMNAEDPTVNRLEEYCRNLFGKEAAVYACSGTQSNQMGLRAHCDMGDEILIESTGHIMNYEAGGPAVLSGVMSRSIPGRYGMLDLADLEGKIRPDNQHFCRTRLLCVENTTNVGGGRVYPPEQIWRICDWAHANDLKTHLDGARVFNAAIASGISVRELCRGFDTISVCFSKGLGCPMGSILVGSEAEIYRARRARKQFGGALRQAGIVAAAALYALEHHVERLEQDHENARHFADLLRGVPGLTIDPEVVESNLVFVSISPELGTAGKLSAQLKERGILINPSGPQRLRACTHLDVTRGQVEQAAQSLVSCLDLFVKNS